MKERFTTDKDIESLGVNTDCMHRATKMHPVMSGANKMVYWISDDERTLCFDVGDAFGGHRLKRSIRYCSAEERTEMIHNYLEDNLPPFCDRVESLILKMGRFGKEEHFVLDDKRLQQYFPNLNGVYCNEVFDLTHGDTNIYMFSPFELGEMAFDRAQEGDFEMANDFTRKLWDLDSKWARFFREVAADYQLSSDQRSKCNLAGNVTNTGLDKLFRIYLLGWYSPNESFEDVDRVYVKEYQNLEKAIELLRVRFKNWSSHEISEKLRKDLEYIEHDEKQDYESFNKILLEAERLYPEGVDGMRKKG